jgi:hypothetical protein
MPDGPSERWAQYMSQRFTTLTSRCVQNSYTCARACGCTSVDGFTGASPSIWDPEFGGGGLAGLFATEASCTNVDGFMGSSPNIWDPGFGGGGLAGLFATEADCTNVDGFMGASPSIWDPGFGGGGMAGLFATEAVMPDILPDDLRSSYLELPNEECL